MSEQTSTAVAASQSTRKDFLMDTETKPALQSAGVWGGIIAVFAGIAGLFGYSVSDTDQTTLATGASAVAGFVGGIIAIWGRMRATKKIG